MERRTFIALVSGGLLGCPISAHAQQLERIYRVGLLTMGTIGPQSTMWNAFLDAMRELGYEEGRNLVVRRGATGDGRPDHLPEFVAGFLGDGVDVIVSTSRRETQAAQRATSTIPIVMTLAPDPVGSGLVESLARPGGNVTGLTSVVPGISEKYVELLKEIVPRASRFIVVSGPIGLFPGIRRELAIAAQRLGVTLSFASVKDADDIDSAFAQAQKDGAGGFIVALDVVTVLHREHLARAALMHRLPGVYWERDYVEAGGLMSYGVSYRYVGRRAAYFVDRLLRGAKPADLPVEQPTKFELVINMKTAKALGVTIPQSLLLRADEVIQ